MQFKSDLTPQQQQVLVSLAQGQTVNAAAAAANIHRNTIANWRRSSETFRGHWHNMQYEQAMHWRDQLQSIAQVAVDAILKTLTDEKTPPSVRLRAALAVLDKVTAVAPAQPGLNASPAMHNVAQPAQPAQPEPLETAPQPRPATAAQPCTSALSTSSLADLFEDLRSLDDDGLADLLDHITMPPRLHNAAQAATPVAGSSGE